MEDASQSQKIPNDLKREIDGEIKANAENNRSFQLSFSSETPYMRWFGPEILDHSDGCIDLARLQEIGVVLFNHDRNAVIGKIDRVWIENNRGCAEITFDSDEESEKIRAKVESGTLKGVSVGYIVKNWETVEDGCKSLDGRFVGPCDIAKSWEPYEISIVSIPADPSVGVGREMEEGRTPESNKSVGISHEKIEMEEKSMPNMNVENAAGVTPATADTQADMARAIADERARIADISDLARAFDFDATTYINNGASVDSFRSALVDHLRTTGAPVRTTAVSQMTDSAEDKFRRAASDALLMRSGLDVDAPADGARQMMAMSLKDLAIESLVKTGANANDLHRKSADEIYQMAVRGFYNPEAAFPAILDQTIEKAYVNGYNKVATTFEQITTKGSLKDFKTHDNNYLAGPVGEFFEVPENGELKHDVFRDEKLPTRKLKTYGRQFTLSRKAFIDDDINLVTSLPARYAAAAKKTINKQVYEILLKNPVIYDGATLFGSAHKNQIATGTGVTQDAVQAMIMALSTQLDQFGEAITIRPAQIVVPAGMAFDIYTLFNSATIDTVGNTQAVNPLFQYRSSIQIVEEPLINALCGGMGQVMPWFMAGAKSDVNGIEVDYLNGQEIPTIRRMEAPGQLGFIWDIYLDWGISVMDYRGFVKNPGVAVNTKLQLA